MKKLLTLTLPLILCIAGVTYLFLPPTVPASPFSHSATLQYGDTTKPNYVILGFLPYWNLKKISPTALASVTSIGYFSLRLDAQGNLVTHVNRREEEPGYTNFKHLVAGSVVIPRPLTLTIAMTDNDALASLLASAVARNAAIQTIIDNAKSARAIGVNIDFEPSGSISQEMRDNFTVFMRELWVVSKRQSNPLVLSVDIYSISATRARLWDIAGLAPSVDYLVIMAYDYFQPSSSQSGPVAPLRGAPALFNEDVTKNLAETLRYIEPGKVLLGLPFYGYSWPTEDGAKYGSPTGTGSLATLSFIEGSIADHSLSEQWDRDSLTPYAVATVSGHTRQYYFENTTSLGLKLDLIKAAHLGGIAIWALGYEGDNSPLWSTISNSLQ